MSLDRDDVRIEYTVKELLGDLKKEQTAGFARIEVSMSGKADKADVARMEARLDAHGERLGTLEQARRDDQTFQSARAWNWGRWEKVGAFMVGSALVIGGALLPTLAALHVI